jgi:hypothetical protein
VAEEAALRGSQTRTKDSVSHAGLRDTFAGDQTQFARGGEDTGKAELNSSQCNVVERHGGRDQKMSCGGVADQHDVPYLFLLTPQRFTADPAHGNFR